MIRKELAAKNPKKFCGVVCPSRQSEVFLKDIFRSLDLDLLRVFSALMAEGNVTRAADQFALSQPAVSNALNRLRSSLDEVLFEKTSSGVQPTARARELWSVIQPHFEALRRAISPDEHARRK